MTQQMEKTNESNSSQNQIRQVRIQKMNNLRERGLNPYPYGYEKDIMAQDLQDKYKDLPVGDETEDYYHVAGRVMANRNTGMFIDLVDASGKIQIFSHKENLSEEFKNTEINRYRRYRRILRFSKKNSSRRTYNQIKIFENFIKIITSVT